ncbi:MAG: riboflavin synthase [Desulfovibrionaceae bacterium]|nr:riboflavin synthase [Desulfovibrionaceae bacterium]
MFTGLVQGQGRIISLARTGKEYRLTIQALFQLDNIIPGESIAVNGACLTVETPGERQFSVYISEETMNRTTLSRLKSGSVVNLERALAIGDRLGGHIVSGHVDCVATIADVEVAGESKKFRITFPKERGPEVIEKGSVALDGISLTINACGSNYLEVNIIPETQKNTTASQWKPGSFINMETDVLGKYVRHMIGMDTHGTDSSGESRITEAFLRENGF